MRVTNIQDEDFVNYRVCSMFIASPRCNGKCWRDLGLNPDICQNEATRGDSINDIPNSVIVDRFKKNIFSKAVVIGGLEPFESFTELFSLIKEFRSNDINCDIVIYTGYNQSEISSELIVLASNFENIVIKFGRYIPYSNPCFDDVLQVTLASDNQYATRLTMDLAIEGHPFPEEVLAAGPISIAEGTTDIKYNKIRDNCRKGNGHCPCYLKKDERSLCICSNFLSDVEAMCHCTIYTKD